MDKFKARLMFPCGNDLSKAISSTLSTMDRIIGATLGPGGRPILIDRMAMPVLITKDGVTVSEFMVFDDALQYTISEAAKEVCQKTNSEAGDGTTTAIVLAKALVEEGVKYLANNAQKSPQELCRELATSLETVTGWLTKMALPVESDKIKEVAMVSSNFDEEIARVVTEAIDMVGEDGTIITVEGSGKGITVELKDGFPVEKGLSELGPVHEVFINNPADQECKYDNPYILLFDGDLLVPAVLFNFISACIVEMNKQNSARPIVIIAHNFSPEVVKLFAVSIKANGMYVCPLMTAGTAQPLSKHHLLHDIAALTGAEVLDGVTNTFQKALQIVQKDPSVNILEVMGSCSTAKVGRYKSVLLGFEDTEELIQERINTLKVQMEKAESDFDAELIKERIAQLAGGVATISVNASSDVEVKEKKHRVEDTIHAIRSAIEMGIVAGGGATQLAISDKIRQVAGKTPDMPVSSLILANALMIPFIRIMTNAGCSQETINAAMVDTIASIDPETLRPGVIYDSLKHKNIDPMKDGVIDPVKVTITALKNALSVSALLMTLGGALVMPRETDPIEKTQEEDELSQN